MDDGAVAIRHIAAGDLPLLDRSFTYGSPGKHHDRLALQEQGSANYFIAWQEDLPVGHLLLVWLGTVDEPMASRLHGCPNIEDLFVLSEHRRRGIGTRLLACAERQVAEFGYPRIGLGVGLTPDYDAARRVYERRGYDDAGFGPYLIRWRFSNEAGREVWVEEACLYLIKSLE